MKKLLLLCALLLPSICKADGIITGTGGGTSSGGGGSGGGNAIYPATSTPTFPFGVNASSFTSTGTTNLQFNNIGDTNTYNLLGISTRATVTNGDAAVFVTSTSVADAGAQPILNTNSLQNGTSLYVLIGQFQNGIFTAYMQTHGIVFSSGTFLTTSSTTLNYDYVNNILNTTNASVNTLFATSTARLNGDVYLNNAAGKLAITNGQTDTTSGLNLQAASAAGNTFTRCFIGSNLYWSTIAGSSWTTSNNFGTDYAGWLCRTNGDMVLSASNSAAANSHFTDAQILANTHIWVTGDKGLMGVGMGANVPTNAQFQVVGTTTVARVAAFGGTAGTPIVSISTTGLFGYVDQGSSPTLSGCGTGPSFIGGNQRAEITPGSGSTGCTFTFTPQAFVLRPICDVTFETGSITNAPTFSWTNAALTISETALGTNKVVVNCTSRD